MNNEELIQKAERWLTWHPAQYVKGSDGAYLVTWDTWWTPPSTQPNPSPVDLSAPDWLARYAIELPGESIDTA